MSSPDTTLLPEAEKLCGAYLRVNGCTRRMVGSYAAVAESKGAFELLMHEVAAHAHAVLGHRFRLLPVRHLVNSIAYQMRKRSTGTRALIPGCVQHLLYERQLLSLGTLSLDRDPYHVVYSFQAMSYVRATIKFVMAKLDAGTCVSAAEVGLSPKGRHFRSIKEHRVLLGAVVYMGLATTDCPAGSPIEIVRPPDAVRG